jgi:hypothetical protein
LARSKITTLAAIADEPGADVAVLAAIKGEPAVMEARVAELRALLPMGTQARWLLFDWADEPSSIL